MKILPNILKVSFFIEIAKPANCLIKNACDLSDVVGSYNAIIQEIAGSSSFVSWHAQQSGPIHLLPDGHHLTALGHQAVAKACLNHYQEVL